MEEVLKETNLAYYRLLDLFVPNNTPHFPYKRCLELNALPVLLISRRFMSRLDGCAAIAVPNARAVVYREIHLSAAGGVPGNGREKQCPK
jgi:hypothetical protein